MIFILIENQKIEIKWNNANKKHYESKGYIYTKMKDIFLVDVKDLSSGSNKEVKILCDYCGEEYYKNYQNYLKSHKYSNKDACNNCKHLKSNEIRHKINIDRLWKDLEDACNDFGYILLTKKEEYVGNKMKIHYICPKHGEQNSIANNLKRGHGCYHCGKEISRNKQLNTTEYITTIIESTNNNKLLNADEYKGAHTMNLNILCSCGNIFTTSFHGYKHGTNRCRECSMSMSTNEKRIYDFLTECNIAFVQEKTFDGCKDKKLLPFDFYIPKYNLCIEFDGQQHYDNYYYKTLKPTVDYVSLEYTQKHDKIKTDYCANNNINLLRIPYWEENNIENLIINKIKKIDEQILGKRYSLVS